MSRLDSPASKLASPAAEVLATGSELTLGRIANTNAQWLSQRLLDLGFDVRFHTAVGDRLRDLDEALRTALARCDLVVVTGGLGPTRDDLTRDVITRVTGARMVPDEAALATIRERMARFKMAMTPSNARQALVPRGAEVFLNPAGMAPGFALRSGRRWIVGLPGVPREMRAIFDAHAAPFLAARFRLPVIETLDLVIAGLPESTVDDRLGALSDPHANPAVGILIRDGAIVVRVRSEARTRKSARAALERVARRIRRLFGTHFVGEGEATLESAVVAALARRGWTLAVAESCTGGLVAHRLTQVPGVSEWFRGGVVAYDSAVKRRLLGVTARVIARYGVVSREVALEMAEGAARRLGADIGAAVTGVAGPTGGTPEIPVGTVDLAVWHRGHATHERRQLPGDRSDVKARAARALLEMIRSACSAK